MKKKQNLFSRGCYKVIRWFVWLFYPKLQLEGLENLPQEPCILTGNHCQMNGPIAAQLYYPGKCTTWCTHEMMSRKEFPAFAMLDFWPNKPKRSQWFYRMLAHLLAPLASLIFNNADTIPVYRDNRLLSTYKQSIAALEAGQNLVIFPESHIPNNRIVNQFHDKFIDTARLYYKRTGKALCFVPVYLAPERKSIFIGKPTRFCPDTPIQEERQRICDYVTKEITEIATALPRHRVIPFSNVAKEQYLYNRDE